MALSEPVMQIPMIMDASGSKFVVDVSGSMCMYIKKVQQLLKMLGVDIAWAFHHRNLELVPREKLGDDFGLTDLGIALMQLISCVKSHLKSGVELNLYFITDGMHNASPADVLYRQMDEFLGIFREAAKDPSVRLNLHVITCGGSFDEELISALQSMHALEYTDNTKITKTTLEGMLKNGCPNPPEILTRRQIVKGAWLLKKYLLDRTLKESVDILVGTILASVYEEEKKQMEIQVTGGRERPENFGQIINLSLGRETKTSEAIKLSQIYAFGAELPKGDSLERLLRRLASSSFGLMLVSDERLPRLLDRVVEGNDYTDIFDHFFGVLVLHQGTVVRMRLTDFYMWIGTHSPTQAVVYQQYSFPFEDADMKTLLQIGLDHEQQKVLQALKISMKLSEYRSIFYLRVASMHTPDFDVVRTILETISQCHNTSYFSKWEFELALYQMGCDIGIKQGDPQTFTGIVNGRDMRPHLVMVFATTLYPEVSPLNPSVKRNDVLASWSMISRFSLDMENFPVELALGSGFDIEAYAKGLTSMSKRGVPFIKNTAAVFVRNRALNNLDPASTKFRDTMINVLSTPVEESIDDEGISLSDEEIAVVLRLCGIRDFETLARHVQSVLRILLRKTKDNVGDCAKWLEIMNAAIQYLPNQAQRNAWRLVQEKYNGIERTETGRATASLLEVGKYARTFLGLFGIPSPTGGWDHDRGDWSVHLHKGLLAYIGQNKEFFPFPNLDGASRIEAVLEKVRSQCDTLHIIHHKNIWHPDVDATRTLQTYTHCLCGDELTGDPVYWNQTKIRVIAPKSDSTSNRGGRMCLEHVGSWGIFPRMKTAKTFLEHVNAIVDTVINNPTPTVIAWSTANGGLDLWQSGNIELLKKNERSRVCLEQLSWFCR